MKKATLGHTNVQAYRLTKFQNNRFSQFLFKKNKHKIGQIFDISDAFGKLIFVDVSPAHFYFKHTLPNIVSRLQRSRKLSHMDNELS